MPGFAADFFQQSNAFDAHAAVNGLAHVVDGEQADTGCRKCFHFNAGATEALGNRQAMNGMLFGINLEFDRNPGQGDRVAQRDQISGALGTLNRGDTSDTEHITFLCRAALNQCQRFRPHKNTAGRSGLSAGFGFFTDIDHMGLAFGVKMSKGIGGHGFDR